VQRREAARQLQTYGCVRGSAADRGRFLKARTETITAKARMINSPRGVLAQLAGRKKRGNDARHPKKETIPNPRTHIKIIHGHFILQPV
jgi:hypothetical protein